MDIKNSSSKQKINRSKRHRSKSDVSINNKKYGSESEENQTSSSNLHKYPLRSQSRSFTDQQTPQTSHYHQQSKKSSSERGKRELVALGATNSQPNTREEPEPSRLTRSGAVLRRSTRNSKGKKNIFFFDNSEHTK